MIRPKAKLYIKFLLAAIVIGGVLGYAYWRSRDFIIGPQIFIEAPQSGITVSESLVMIKGSAKNISELRLNGRRIFIDEAGAIREELLLAYGFNVFELFARDKFGRETSKTLELVYR